MLERRRAIDLLELSRDAPVVAAPTLVSGTPPTHGGAGQGAAAAHLPTRTNYPLGLVLDACPDIRDYARGSIGS